METAESFQSSNTNSHRSATRLVLLVYFKNTTHQTYYRFYGSHITGTYSRRLIGMFRNKRSKASVHTTIKDFHSSAALAALRSTLRSKTFPVIMVYMLSTSVTVDSKWVVPS